MTHAPRRTLLIGASGQLGRALARQFAGATLVTASHRHAAPGELRIDLGDADDTRSMLRRVQPHVVLVAGAMCNVDQCEREPTVCDRINTRGPAVIGEYAREHDARVVFFGTDHVFDGRKGSYVEEDDTNPLNVYSLSKARAEGALRDLIPDRHVIIRTGWVYGPDTERRNFVLRLIDRISAGETVAVPSDQWGSPTYTEDIAAATRFLVDRKAAGTFHATGPDFLSRAALAVRVCEHFGLETSALDPRPTEALGQAARRSLRVLLDCRKLRETGARPFRDVEDGLRTLDSWVRGPLTT
jgi:dTDP-4-dehydrorhamnose reductase